RRGAGQRSGGPSQGPVLVDPPAALAVAGDRRRGPAARARRIIVEAVLVRAADAQPGVRAGHVHAAGHRVEEVGAAAAPGGTEAFWHPGGHGGLVEPLPHGGAEVTGLAAAVEQVEDLVGRSEE